MRQGLFLPAFDPLADPRVMADVAVEAEQAGWDAVFVWDHLLYADPVQRVADPWICMAAMLMVTERLLTGPMVTPLSRRRPQVLAKQAAGLDQLSDGRLVLGFGLGDDGGAGEDGRGELSRFGDETDPRARARLLDDGLDQLAGLLRGDADGASFLPAPTHPIPTWIGARWPNRAPLRRAARHDGVFAINLAAPSDVEALCAVMLDLRGSLDGYDIVAELPAGQDGAPWLEAGATWLLTRLGPYELDLAQVLQTVRAGPG